MRKPGSGARRRQGLRPAARPPVSPAVQHRRLNAALAEDRHHVGAILRRMVDRLEQRHRDGHLVRLTTEVAPKDLLWIVTLDEHDESLAAAADSLPQVLDAGERFALPSD